LTRQTVEISEGTARFSPVSTGITLALGNPFGVPAGTPLDAVLAPRFLDDSILGIQGGSTTLTMPDQFTLGTAFQLTPRVKLLFDWQWVNWEVFDELVIELERAGTSTIVEDYRPSNGFRLGAEFALNRATTFRGGFLSHGAAAPAQTVTPNLPEGKRSELTVGLGTRLTSSLRIDLAYQYIDQADRRGRSTDGGLAVPTAAVNNGLYTFSAHLVGATATLTF
jgi:long-chain fatty acid transport protein